MKSNLLKPLRRKIIRQSQSLESQVRGILKITVRHLLVLVVIDTDATGVVDVRLRVISARVALTPIVKMLLKDSDLRERSPTPEIVGAARPPVTFAHTLEQSAETQSLPSDLEIKRVVVARSGVADYLHVTHVAKHIVALVDFLISILVIQDDISRTP